MTDARPPDSNRDATDGTPLPDDRASVYRTPGWVKVFAAIIVLLAILLVASLLVGVRHGPGMHAPSGDTRADPAAVLQSE